MPFGLNDADRQRMAAGTSLDSRSPLFVVFTMFGDATEMAFTPETFLAIGGSATPLESRLAWGAAMQMTHELMHPSSYAQEPRVQTSTSLGSEHLIERDLNVVRRLHGLPERLTGLHPTYAASDALQLDFFRGEYMGDDGYESFRADQAPRSVWLACTRAYCR